MVGLTFRVASDFWLQFIFNDTVIEIMLTLAVSHLAYFMAQDGADCSGILTVMALGMFYSLIARRAFKGDDQQSLHPFWQSGISKEELARWEGLDGLYLTLL